MTLFVFSVMIPPSGFAASGLLTFTQEDAGYQFSYPATFGAFPGRNTANTYIGYTDDEEESLMSIDVYPGQRSIQQFVDRSYAEVERRSLGSQTVDGVAGQRYSFSGIIEGVQEEGEAVLVLRKGTIYALAVWSRDRRDIELFDETVLATFHFLDAETTGGKARTPTASTFYNNEAGGYSFTVPAGWEATLSEDDGLKALFGPPGNTEFGSVEVIGHTLSLDDFLDTTISAMQTNMPGLRVTDRHAVNVGGRPGVRLRITDEEDMDAEGVFVLRDTIIYSIGIQSTGPDDLEKLDALLASFTFSKERPKIYGFPDVPGSHPYVQAIGYVQEQGIVSGYPDGTFRPDAPINRAEFTKIFLGTLLDTETLSSCAKATIKLSDVPDDAWFAPYVCAAKERGIIQGYPDGTFRGTQNVNMAEAAKIIISAILASVEKELEPSDPWYKAPLEGLAALGAIPMTVQRVDSPLTRGEMAEILYRLQQERTDLPSGNYQTLLP